MERMMIVMTSSFLISRYAGCTGNWENSGCPGPGTTSEMNTQSWSRSFTINSRDCVCAHRKWIRLLHDSKLHAKELDRMARAVIACAQPMPRVERNI